MAAKIVPRWEWRTFGDDFGAAEETLAALVVDRVEESDDLYLLFRDGDATVKVRYGLLDIKGLLAVDDDGLEQWVPVAKHAFPVSRDDVAAALDRLQVIAPPRLDRETYTAEELLDEVVPPIDCAASRDGAQATHALRLRAAAGPRSASSGSTRAPRARSCSSPRTPHA